MPAIRQLPSQNTGASLPVDAVDWQNRADTEVEALWRYIGAPLVSVAGTNAVTAASDITVVSAITAYQVGQKFSITPAVTNTGAVTINIDSVGVVNLHDQDGNSLLSGNFISGRRYLIEYNNPDFRILAAGLLAPTPPSPAAAMILQDQKTQNTSGGTFTSGAFQQRALNTVVRNVISGASLSANQFTLPAGTFFIRWSAPAYNVNNHQSRLQNITDANTPSGGIGTTEYAAAASTVMNRSFGSTVVTLTVSKTFEIEHRCTTTGTTNGFGLAANFSTEVYTIVEVFIG